MVNILIRAFQSAFVSSIIAASAAVMRSHSFHLIPIGIYTIIEFVFYLVVVLIAALVALCISAFISTRVRSTTIWAQRIAFFAIVLAPSVLSYLTFYRGLSDYQQGRSVLVIDHQLTAAGVESLAWDIGISAVIAVIATAVYFRGDSQPIHA